MVGPAGINKYLLKIPRRSDDGCRHLCESQMGAKVGGQRRRFSALHSYGDLRAMSVLHSTPYLQIPKSDL